MEIYSVLIVNLIDQLFNIDTQRIFEEKEDVILYGKYREFMGSWINIEYKLKELSRNVVEIEKSPSKFNGLISIITENNILSKALIIRILFLNHSKNLIVHQEKDYTIDEIERYIEIANEVYNELLLIRT